MQLEYYLTISYTVKLIKDKNDCIKKINKDRKKNNLIEFDEIALYNENRQCKLDKKGPDYIINRLIEIIDISYNPIQNENILEMIKIINNKDSEQNINQEQNLNQSSMKATRKSITDSNKTTLPQFSLSILFKGISNNIDITEIHNLPILDDIKLEF